MKMDEFFNYLSKGEIPPEPLGLFRPDISKPLNPSRLLSNYKARLKAISYGMWAIVDLKWTKLLADWASTGRVLEIMAGAGWIAKALTLHGVDIIATDDYSWDAHDSYSRMKKIHKIEKLTALDAVAQYGDNSEILLVSWVPYDETDICEACDLWGTDKPIIFIGEGGGGCNATDEFFENFQEINGPKIPLQQWEGLHDYVQFGYWARERR